MLLFFLGEENQLFKFHPSALLHLFFVLKKTHIMSLVKRMIITFYKKPPCHIFTVFFLSAGNLHVFGGTKIGSFEKVDTVESFDGTAWTVVGTGLKEINSGMIIRNCTSP
jgi:hypothetical protein